MTESTEKALISFARSAVGTVQLAFVCNKQVKYHRHVFIGRSFNNQRQEKAKKVKMMKNVELRTNKFFSKLILFA